VADYKNAVAAAGLAMIEVEGQIAEGGPDNPEFNVAVRELLAVVEKLNEVIEGGGHGG
jgi:hypothetical protein